MGGVEGAGYPDPLRDSGLGRPTTYPRRRAYQAPLTPSLEKLEVRLLGLLGKGGLSFP